MFLASTGAPVLYLVLVFMTILKTGWQEANQGPLAGFYFITEIPHYRISMGIDLSKKKKILPKLQILNV